MPVASALTPAAATGTVIGCSMGCSPELREAGVGIPLWAKMLALAGGLGLIIALAAFSRR